MVKQIIELSSKFPPKFAGQKAYCEELRSWVIAVKSASGRGFVWLIPPRNIN